MTNPPKVSIMMIAYNHKDYIREAIDSALAQDYPNFEVVVADDASTDGTAEIVAGYAVEHPDRVVAVLNTANLGITRNSNTGLRACSGDLIALMDSDDIMLPGKISAQAKWFAHFPDGALCGHALEVFYEDHSRSPHLFSRKLLTGIGARLLIRFMPFGKSSVMVRADCVPRHGFDEALSVVSDLLMWIEVVGEDRRFGFVEGILGRYRRHGENVTNDPFKNLDQVARYLRLVRERFPMFADEVQKSETRRLYYDVAIALLRTDQKKSARQMILRAIKREPSFTKAWIRLAQTLM